MRLGRRTTLGLVAAIFVVSVLACAEEPHYVLTPWAYGVIAWVGGLPSDVQSASAAIAQAVMDVLTFWELPFPEPIPAESITQTSSFWWKPGHFYDQQPPEEREQWYPDGGSGARSWWVTPCLPWNEDEKRPLLVVVFPDFEAYGLGLGAYGPLGLFVKNGDIEEGYDFLVTPANWLVDLVDGHPSLLLARGSNAWQPWTEALHHGLAHWVYENLLDSEAAVELLSSTEENIAPDGSIWAESGARLQELLRKLHPARESSGDPASIPTDAEKLEFSELLWREMNVHRAVDSLLEEGFAQCTAFLLAGDPSWIAVSAELCWDLSILEPSRSVLSFSGAASVVREVARRVGSANLLREIPCVVVRWRAEVPFLEARLREELDNVELDDSGWELYLGLRENLPFVEQMLDPIMSNEARDILKRVLSGEGRAGDVEAFWSEVTLPTPPPDENTWQHLIDREASFTYYAECNETAQALADRVRQQLASARMTVTDWCEHCSWYEYRSWFLYGVRTLVAGLVPASPKSSGP